MKADQPHSAPEQNEAGQSVSDSAPSMRKVGKHFRRSDNYKLIYLLRLRAPCPRPEKSSQIGVEHGLWTKAAAKSTKIFLRTVFDERLGQICQVQLKDMGVNYVIRKAADAKTCHSSISVCA